MPVEIPKVGNMFTPNQIKDRLQKRPFVPFKIVTSSGEEYVVHHPELALVGTRDVSIGKPGPDDPTLYDDVDRVAIMHITALKDARPSAKKKT